MTVTKAWDDSNNQDGIRLETVTVVLVKNGEATDKTLILSADNNWIGSFTELVRSLKVTEDDDWSWTFTDFPKYADGKEITYTITEDAVDGYITTVKGYDVTNTLKTTATETESKTKTGDQSPLARYFSLMIAALGVLGVGAAYRRRKQSAQK